MTMMTTQRLPLQTQHSGPLQPARSSEDLLSRSLGDYSSRGGVQRHVSDVSNIAYAGYLLKRSNLPCQTIISPFPAAAQESDDFLVSPPPLQPIPARFDSSEHDNQDESLYHLPLHVLMNEPKSLPETKEDEDEKKDSSFEQSLEFAELFFGVDLRSLTSKQKVEEPKQEEPPIYLAPQQQERSAPIKVGGRSLSRRSSANDTDPTKPADFVDPHDGHLWRSKYCVLEGGILYFYRNQSEAESPEAHTERQSILQDNSSEDNTTTTTSITNLSNSPIATCLVKHDDEHNTEAGLWEKRVALDCVGAVRSAEVEYGKNSFELLAVDEDDSDNKLVLQAGNAEEMAEWLFQFHRAIAMFVKNMMDHVGSIPGLGDIHHPVFSHRAIAPISMETSPVRTSTLVAAFSPQYHKQLVGGNVSLSHGHGRLSQHRRRQDLPPKHKKKPPSPESPQLPFQVTGLESTSRLVTPFPKGRRPPRAAGAAARPAELSPELSAPQSAVPEMERPPPSKPGGKYVPPHLRKRTEALKKSSTGKCMPPHLRNNASRYVPPHLRNSPAESSAPTEQSELMSLAERAAMEPKLVEEDEGGSMDEMEMMFDDDDDEPIISSDAESDYCRIKLGGCADPDYVVGSILDQMYIPRKASRLGKVQSDPYGFNVENGRLRWEIGAVSECGVRDSNEDSYLIAGDLSKIFGIHDEHMSEETVWNQSCLHPPGLFALFDGHCGNHAARFAAERLTRYIYDESLVEDLSIGDSECSPDEIEGILRKAIARLDREFCDLCIEEGRAWESGATALVAALVNEHLVIANLGDARGVMSRSVAGSKHSNVTGEAGWTKLPADDYSGSRRCLWKTVADVHSPARDDERKRIEKANGWITTETEIPIGQLKRMALFDEDVVDILKRCFADRYHSGDHPSPKAAAPQRILQISRVCGELAVSRAIGDRDFKASHNSPCTSSESLGEWVCQLLLPYPDDHSRCFSGDLVSNIPDFQALRVGEAGVSDEFLLLACDGLWDVMDPDDAVRVTRDLLFEKEWPAKKAAARLAELAIHLGSSDNITVIVVRFFDRQG